MKSEERKQIQTLVNSLLLLFAIHCSLFIFCSCGSGDDDGSRLAEQIVGTWYRGWEDSDFEIVGEEEFAPENYNYHYFTFNNDGTYNGMVRDGSFCAYDTYGDTIYAGTYKCDNDNLRLEYKDEGGRKQKIQALVLSYDETFIKLEYKLEYTNTQTNLPNSVTIRIKLSSTPTTPPDIFGF